MGGDSSKGDNSPLDSIKNLADKSIAAKMEKAFDPLQELIILRMEANLSDLVLTKSQFLELMTNAGFDLNPDRDGDINLTKQIQFIMDKGILVEQLFLDEDGHEFTTFTQKEEGHWYLFKRCRKVHFLW